MSISQQPFGTLADGRPVTAYVLRNDQLRAVFLDYGCILQSLQTADCRELILGYERAEDYARGCGYIGELVGRVANRLGGAAFTLNGNRFQLEANEKENHLHGTWGSQFYQADINQDQLVLFRRSPAGEEGYPGNIDFRVTVSLRGSCLRMDYDAVSDADTLLNPTHHVYFNLSGDKSIADHVLSVQADSYTPVDAALLPSGQLSPVKETEMDLRMPVRLGSRVFDHNFCLRGEEAAEVSCGGVKVMIRTSQPGLQVYTGDYLDSDPVGRWHARSGVALETQHYPDAMNHPAFPSIVLHAGEKYRQFTEYQIDF